VASLLEQFLKEEANPHVCRLILGAVHDQKKHPDEVQRKFEFNRFDLTLDFISNVALIEDILDPLSNGEVRLQLDEFVGHISQKRTGP